MNRSFLNLKQTGQFKPEWVGQYSRNFQSRIGTRQLGQELSATAGAYKAASQQFELTDHLGSVRAVVDGTKEADGSATILALTDYYPGGMSMPGRSYTSSATQNRFGYQGSERDPELLAGNAYTTHFRMLDPRLGRWFTTDVVTQPWQSPYCSMDNNPIALMDRLGASTHGGGGEPCTTCGTGGAPDASTEYDPLVHQSSFPEVVITDYATPVCGTNAPTAYVENVSAGYSYSFDFSSTPQTTQTSSEGLVSGVIPQNPKDTYVVKQSDVGGKIVFGGSYTKRSIKIPYDPNNPDWHAGRTLVQKGGSGEIGSDIGVSAMGGKGTLIVYNKKGNSLLEHLNSGDKENNSYFGVDYFIGAKQTTVLGTVNGFKIYDMVIYSAGMVLSASPVDGGASPPSEPGKWGVKGGPLSGSDSSDVEQKFIDLFNDSTLYNENH